MHCPSLFGKTLYIDGGPRSVFCLTVFYFTSFLLLVLFQLCIFPCLYIYVSAPDRYSTTAASERCLTLLLFMSKTRWEGGREGGREGAREKEVGLKGVGEGSYNMTFSKETWGKYKPILSSHTDQNIATVSNFHQMPVQEYLAKTRLSIALKSLDRNYIQNFCCPFLVPFEVGLDCGIEA